MEWLLAGSAVVVFVCFVVFPVVVRVAEWRGKRGR